MLRDSPLGSQMAQSGRVTSPNPIEEADMADRQEVGAGFLRKCALAAVSALALIVATPDAQAGPKGTDRPIKGTCETEVTPLDIPDGAPPNLVAVLAVDVECRLGHLGLTVGGTSEELVFATDLLPDPPAAPILPILIVIERITYVAANGDELWSSFRGPGTLDLATGKAEFSGTETFYGGTGRFKNATGTSLTAGEAVGGEGFLTISGTISY